MAIRSLRYPVTKIVSMYEKDIKNRIVQLVTRSLGKGISGMATGLFNGDVNK